MIREMDAAMAVRVHSDSPVNRNRNPFDTRADYARGCQDIGQPNYRSRGRRRNLLGLLTSADFGHIAAARLCAVKWRGNTRVGSRSSRRFTRSEG